MTSEDMRKAETQPLLTNESRYFFSIVNILMVVFILAGAVSIGLMLFSILQFVAW